MPELSGKVEELANGKFTDRRRATRITMQSLPSRLRM
jgi:hypothetical protein